MTKDGKTKIKPPSSVLSTAEAISVLFNSGILAQHFGSGKVTPAELSRIAGGRRRQGGRRRSQGGARVLRDGGQGARRAVERVLRGREGQAEVTELGAARAGAPLPGAPPLAAIERGARRVPRRGAAAGGAHRGAGRRDLAARRAGRRRRRGLRWRSSGTGPTGRRARRSGPSRRTRPSTSRPGGASATGPRSRSSTSPSGACSPASADEAPSRDADVTRTRTRIVDERAARRPTARTTTAGARRPRGVRQGARIPLVRGVLGGLVRGARVRRSVLPRRAPRLRGAGARGRPEPDAPRPRRVHGARRPRPHRRGRRAGADRGRGRRGARRRLRRRRRRPLARGAPARARAQRGDAHPLQLPPPRRAARLRRRQPRAAVLPARARRRLLLYARHARGAGRVHRAPAPARLHGLARRHHRGLPARGLARRSARQGRAGPRRGARGDHRHHVPRRRHPRRRLPLAERHRPPRRPGRQPHRQELAPGGVLARGRAAPPAADRLARELRRSS